MSEPISLHVHLLIYILFPMIDFVNKLKLEKLRLIKKLICINDELDSHIHYQNFKVQLYRVSYTTFNCFGSIYVFISDLSKREEFSIPASASATTFQRVHGGICQLRCSRRFLK